MRVGFGEVFGGAGVLACGEGGFDFGFGDDGGFGADAEVCGGLSVSKVVDPRTESIILSASIAVRLQHFE